MKKNGKGRKVKLWIFGILLLIAGTTVALALSSFFLYTRGITLDTAKVEASSKGSFVSFYDSEKNLVGSEKKSVDIEELSETTKNAFIAKEDKRFYKHHGYDILRIFGAMKENITSKDIKQGASTISQQLIKNTQLSPERTMKRKVQEIYLATKLEDMYEKEEILEMYLNSIYFGNNCYGLETAANYYFGKNAKDLSLAESATLAGLLSAPSEYNPVANKETAIEKRNSVLKQMQKQKYISEEECETALSEDIILSTKDNLIEGYLESARSEACRILGVTDLAARNEVKILTNMNTSLQEKITESAVSGNFTKPNKNGVMSDITYVVMENENGNVVACGGSFFVDIGNFRRQPASTIKPILVYAPAIENNMISPASFIYDDYINYDGYSPKNSAYGYTGWTTVRESLTKSLNVPAVKILRENGIDSSMEFAKKAGITFHENDRNLAIALGGMTEGSTMIEMAGAYQSLANGGVKSEGGLVSEIIVDGITVYKREYKKEQIMKDSTAYLVTDILRDVSRNSLGKKLSNLGFEVASKTGTGAGGDGTNNDAWNISFTREHTVVCWIGNTHGAKGLMDETTNGSTYPTLFVRDVLEKMYSTSKPKAFEKPQSVEEVELDTSLFESQLLRRSTENTPSRYRKSEIFARDNSPADYSENFTKLKTPNIWIEYETYPEVIFQSQPNVNYEIFRTTYIPHEGQQNRNIFEIMFQNFKNKPFSEPQTLETNQIGYLLGNGRRVSFRDELCPQGENEYFVIARNETEEKQSNKIKVLMQ